MVASGFAYPVDVVVELSCDVGAGMTALVHEHFGSESVGDFQIMRIAGGADPAERSETIVEEHGSHDVLHVGGIAETSVGQRDICTCAT